MKILMMRPKPSKETIGLQYLIAVEPLELEVLAATVTEEVIIIDMILEKKSIQYYIKKYSPEVFCVTGYISHTNIMKLYCKAVKEFNPQIITIAGGVYLEKNPEIFESKWIDYRVVRNATISFPQLIAFLKHAGDFPEGVWKQGDKNMKLPDYNFYFPIPKRELIQRYQRKYYYIVQNKVALIKTSFGCPYSCNFCFCRNLTDGLYYERNLQDVIQELKGIWQKEIYIVDDNFLVSENRIKNFIDAVKKNNIHKRYLIYGRSDFIAEHETLLQEFKNIGLRAIIVGIESFNDLELKEYNKDLSADINEKALNVLNSLKIDIYNGIIIPPSWDKHDFLNLQKKIFHFNLLYTILQPLTPLTNAMMEINRSKIILNKEEYDKWDLAHVVIQPEKLTIKEFYQCMLNTYRKVWFRPKNMLFKLINSPNSSLRLFFGALKVIQQYKRRVQNA